MIKCAAVRVCGRIYEGKRHSDAFRAAIAADVIGDGTRVEQGFVTDTGDFLSRLEAWDHAVACGQITPRLDGKTVVLMSEDLY